MSKNFGVGIIGAGIIFEQHVRAYAQLSSQARLLGVAEVDETRLRKSVAQHDIPFATPDYRKLLERDDIDIVTVCTPPCFHERIVIDALEAGKYVLCEKPLAHTLQAADRILDVARRFSGRLSTVYQFRYLPDVQRTVWLRDKQLLGPLLFGRFSRYARFQRPGKTRMDWWGRWDVAGGGAMMTQLIHELDQMFHIFGPAVEVSAVMDTLKEPIESEDTCAVTVRFESGAMACCYGTVSAQRSTHGFDVIGKLASVHCPWSLESMDKRWRQKALQDVLAVYPMTAGASWRSESEPCAHTPYIADVLDAIETGRPLPIGPDEARASLELCVGIYASALAGRPVSLPIEKTSPYYGGIAKRDYDRRSWRRFPQAVCNIPSPGQATNQPSSQGGNRQ
ncbi:MAG: Gfo/Idh/MocA family protein [Candidatus Binatia bacterium]